MDRWSIPSHATLRSNAVAAQEKCSPTASVLQEAICVVTASLNTLKRPTPTLKATSRFTVDCNIFCDCLCSQIECHTCIFTAETYHWKTCDEIHKDLLVPPLFIEGNSHSYNRSIFVFARATVPY